MPFDDKKPSAFEIHLHPLLHTAWCPDDFFQGVLLPGFVMACELFATKYRTFAGIIVGNFWAVITCLFAVLAYLVNKWFHQWVHLQLVISLLGLLSIPLYWYYTVTHHHHHHNFL